ncbi:GNAT family N-acetyltransferase [Pedobacter immunditicola]|uniref:GNAT family N-acetyltransferase n=1 Tax=Pedobacter immunditicola TaxID=3133440 RepID=UPI0030A3C7DE
MYRNFIIREESEWNAYTERALAYEIYHTWYYHTLNKEGEPLLFVFEEGDWFIALPLIKREISGTSFYDLTSVYGHSGPFSNKDLSTFSRLTNQNFKTAFINFMHEERCICVFSRLHPFLNQQYLLENIGGLKDNGKTIYMDLTIPLEEQKKRYEKRLYRQVKKLRQSGYLIKEADSQEEIKMFTDMYWQNMDRLNASPNYYFDEQYFTNLLNSPTLESKLILIYNGPELICGAIILLSNEIIRNHLSATASHYLKESPSKLMTDEISMIGRRTGKKVFHLGGGVGGKEDNLFKFKSHFSNLLINDTLWCYIDNNEVYNSLVTLHLNNQNFHSEFFPLYRKSFNKEIIANQNIALNTNQSIYEK